MAGRQPDSGRRALFNKVGAPLTARLLRMIPMGSLGSERSLAEAFVHRCLVPLAQEMPVDGEGLVQMPEQMAARVTGNTTSKVWRVRPGVLLVSSVSEKNGVTSSSHATGSGFDFPSLEKDFEDWAGDAEEFAVYHPCSAGGLDYMQGVDFLPERSDGHMVRAFLGNNYAANDTNYCASCQTGGRLLADRSLSRLLKDDWPKTLEELEES